MVRIQIRTNIFVGPDLGLNCLQRQTKKIATSEVRVKHV